MMKIPHAIKAIKKNARVKGNRRKYQAEMKNRNPLNWMIKHCQSTTLRTKITETMEPISKAKRIEKSLKSKIIGY